MVSEKNALFSALLSLKNHELSGKSHNKQSRCTCKTPSYASLTVAASISWYEVLTIANVV